MLHAAASSEAAGARPSACAPVGRAVYEAQQCAMCHSIGGAGNPRYSLDRADTARPGTEIRNWIIGAREIEGELASGPFRIKQKYRALSAEELDALVCYIQSVRN